MGDCRNEDLRVQFDRRLKPKFFAGKVTTDAGGKVLAPASVEARPRNLTGHDSGDGDSGIGSAGEETDKSPALDTGGRSVL